MPGDIHSCEMHTRKTHAYGIRAREVHVYEVHTCEVHTYEMHCHEVYAHEVYPHGKAALFSASFPHPVQGRLSRRPYLAGGTKPPSLRAPESS
jgi:hypothetical protein